jgi:hypothetical protein
MPQPEREQPGSLADLHLPPTFVADHVIRTLASQGALTLAEMAKHWRIPNEVALQVIEPQKVAGLIETETNRSNLETLQKWRLSAPGQARVETARARTWYAGPLPVSLADYERHIRDAGPSANGGGRLVEALRPLFLDDAISAEIAQAMAAGASLALGGIAPDEQHAFAAAIHNGLDAGATVQVPVAIFAAGAVIRVFDPRVHRVASARARTPLGMEDSDLLRTRENESQWADVTPPVVAISGGVLPTDVVPPFDEDARFYLAPAPLTAAGGLLAICDAAASEPHALDTLARNWIVPAQRGTGVVLLRTGERIEVPWSAALVLFAHAGELPGRAAAAVQYTLDASVLQGAALRHFLAARMRAVRADAVETIAALIERTDMATRASAAAVTRYLIDCQAYLGSEFALTEQTLSAALHYAAARPAASPMRRVA